MTSMKRDRPIPHSCPTLSAVRLRTEEPEDHAAVGRLHVAAFEDHGQVVADLVEDLRALVTSSDGLSLVAEDDTGVVGHVLFTRSLLDAPRRLVDVQVLSPIAVTPGRQGQGIGSALIRDGLATMAERGVPVVFLEGDPGYYSRLGFRPGTVFGFRKPSLRIPGGAFQALTLSAYQSWMTGTLVYSEIFWRHDAVGLRDSNHEGP